MSKWKPIIFQPTQGMKSRTRKLTDVQARQIRFEYASGKRGKANAHRFGISPAHYNVVGRKQLWQSLDYETKPKRKLE